MKTIAVITFALESRKELLLKCINSIRGQLVDCRVKHYIFYKDDIIKDFLLEKSITYVKAIKYKEKNISYTSQKMAVLRNIALNFIDEDYVCFLDDDNEYSNIHLQSLYNLIMKNGLQAAHSWRYLVYSDETLFDGSYYPWHNKNSLDVKREIHQWSVENNIIKPGSAVLRDCYILDDSPLNISNVDMNEWLFLTSMIKSIRFDEEFSLADKDKELAEDFKLLLRILKHDIDYSCSDLATVKYRLGGFSNNVTD